MICVTFGESKSLISDVLVTVALKLSPLKMISIINISQMRSEDYEPSVIVVLNKYFKKHGGFPKKYVR